MREIWRKSGFLATAMRVLRQVSHEGRFLAKKRGSRATACDTYEHSLKHLKRHRINPGAGEELVCPACGYDLRAISSENCPECGLAIDRAAISISRIPWEHRKEIGRFRTYWRTTRLVMFHPRRLAEEMNRPIEYRNARRFQFVVVTLAWVPLAGWIFALLIQEYHPRFQGPGRVGWFLEALVLGVGTLSFWLMILLASGVASYWFHPRRMSIARQNRAITLSYYVCAPAGVALASGGDAGHLCVGRIVKPARHSGAV